MYSFSKIKYRYLQSNKREICLRPDRCGRPFYILKHHNHEYERIQHPNDILDLILAEAPKLDNALVNNLEKI